MRFFKIFCVAVLLAAPVAAIAAKDVPDSADWYVYIDLQRMKSEEAGKPLYDWFNDEVILEVKDEAGIDIEKEVNSLTAFSVRGEGPVIVVEGDFTTETKDKLMAVIAAGGDISPLKASGRTYYRVGDGDGDGEVSYKSDDIDLTLDSLDDGGWVSLDIKDKILFTGTEAQMKNLLANKGRVPGPGKGKGALLVLTAEKTLLQASMNTGMLSDDGSDDIDSKILRNTEQVAFLLAIVADKLAVEAELTTSEPEMAESLASVARGLISLAAFDDSMDAEMVAMLQSTKIEAKGNSLNLSLAVDPGLVVRTIGN
ncbi:MAG: hypothetical protein JJ992_29340 [Planctomycetes bacterium]|nr:hypothetical protein [Planctomycetota bacterium]